MYYHFLILKYVIWSDNIDWAVSWQTASQTMALLSLGQLYVYIFLIPLSVKTFFKWRFGWNEMIFQWMFLTASCDLATKEAVDNKPDHNTFH